MHKYLAILILILLSGCAAYRAELGTPHYDWATAEGSQVRGNCQKKADATYRYLVKRGYPAKIAAGMKYDDDLHPHMWVETWRGKDRYVLDPSDGDHGWIIKNPVDEYAKDNRLTALYQAKWTGRVY